MEENNPRLKKAILEVVSDAFSIWWFDADHSVARQMFLKRADFQINAFEKQVSDISRD